MSSMQSYNKSDDKIRRLFPIRNEEPTASEEMI